MRMAKNTNRRVTMNTEAKQAGVSQTTVSYVINDVTSANIPEETRSGCGTQVETRHPRRCGHCRF